MNEENQELTSPEMNEALPSGLLSPSDLLKNAWEIYKKNWQLLVSIMLVPLLLTYAFVFFFVGTTVVGLSAIFINPGIANVSGIISGLVIGVIFLLLIVVIQIWGQMALVYALTHHHEPQGVVSVFKKAWSYVLPYLWITILMGLAILGGFIIFIIPGIILSIWFVFSSWSLVNENKKGLKALSASREYFRGYGWEVFFRLVVILALSWVATAVVGLLFKESPAEGIAGFILSIFLAPFVMTYIFALYENLKAIKGEKSEGELKTRYISVFSIIGLVVVILLFVLAGFGFNYVDKEALVREIQSELELIESEAPEQIPGIETEIETDQN